VIVNVEVARLLKHVRQTDTCWLWIGATSPTGYGNVTFRGRSEKAHRAMYRAVVGSIPPRRDLDHTCRVRRCVRPEHLEPVTRRENLRRGIVAAGVGHIAAHCVNGHPWNAANTLERSNGYRVCRVCNRQRMRQHIERFGRRSDAGRDRSGRVLTTEEKAKQAARRALRYAIRKGLVIRPTVCSQCPRTRRIQAHHHDYSKPFDVAWLCSRCHGRRHRLSDEERAA
jgi:hypothetical protein